MSAELEPFPVKIEPRVHAVLRAMSNSTGKHKNQIAREVLTEWAEKQINTGNLISKELQVQGYLGIDGNISE